MSPCVWAHSISSEKRPPELGVLRTSGFKGTFQSHSKLHKAACKTLLAEGKVNSSKEESIKGSNRI